MKTIYITIISIVWATLSFAQNTVSYQYDNEGRIIHSDDGTKVQQYQYDNLGNRTSYFISSTTILPDLSVSNSSIPDTNITQGQTYIVSATIDNLENVDVIESTLKVYLSSTTTGTETLVGTYVVPSINANGNTTVNFDISIPLNANIGNQFLVFYIDAINTINETDESNNKESITVIVSEPNLAELNIQNATINPVTIQAGNSIDVSAEIHNTGSQNAGSFVVKSFLSLNETYEVNDLELTNTSETYNILNAGTNIFYSKTTLIPTSTIEGNYYVLFVVDFEETVIEIDETNNVTPVSIVVLNTTEGTIVSDFTANITNISIGDTVQFLDQSTNNPTSWLWTFEGGTPSTSTQQNPEITYNTDGAFDVTLIATNSSGNSTETKINYITTGSCQGVWDFVGIDGFSQGSIGNIKIEINNNGIPYVAFVDYANSSLVTVMKYNGSAWVLVGTAGFSGVAVDYLDLKITNNNIPYVAYISYVANVDSKVTVKKFNGSSWINVGSPNFTGKVINSPSLAISNTNQPYVAFQEVTNNNRLAVMKFNGSWVYVGTPGISNGGVGTVFQSLEIDSSNNVYVAYEDVTNSERIAVKKYDGGSTWSYVGVSGVSVGKASYPSLAFGVANIPYLAYNDEVNNDKTTVKRFTNGVWSTVGSEGFGNSGSSYQKMIVSNDFIPYVSIKNSSATSVMKYISGNGNWEFVGPVDVTNTSANYQIMTLDDAGIPYLVYRDGANSNKASVLKYDCDTSINADFYANQTTGITDSVITFTDASTNSPTSWDWSFSPNTLTYTNGTNSTSQNPEVTFNNEGLYTVTLTASNSESSDIETKTDYINIVSQYTLIVNIIGNGSVNPNGGSYADGEILNITATADIGFSFIGWSGDLSGTANPETITMDANKTVTATFNDIETPAALCQNLTIQLDTNGTATVLATDIDNGSTDNIGIASYSLDIDTFTCDDLGDNTVVLTVTDEAGNADICTAIVTVEDNINPIAITQNIIIGIASNGEITIVVEDIANGSTDNCDIVSSTIDIDTFTCNDIGENTVTLTVTDTSGNTDTANAIVTVEDTLLPIVITQNITVQLDANGEASIVPADIENGSTDNCGIDSNTFSLDITNFTCDDIGDVIVVLSVTDVNGNTGSAIAFVTVEDNLPPTVITQNATVQLDANGVVNIGTSILDNGSTDNCDITLSLSQVTFTCDDLGENTVTLIGTDSSDNSDSDTAILTVEDIINPIAIGQDITIDLIDDNPYIISPNDIDDGSTDNCDFSLSVDIDTFTTIGVYPVIFTIIDTSGNTDTSTVEVTVIDTTLGIDEQDGSVFTIYPNPTKESIFITSNEIIKNLTIFDVSGKKVYTNRVEASQIEISVTNFASGVYFVRTKTESRMIIKKLVKE